MIDGILCLIVFIAAVIGAAKGIGDTIIRIAAVIGGGALAFLYSGKVGEYLKGTSVNRLLHDHIYLLLRGREAAEEAPDVVTGDDSSIAGMLSKSLTGLFTNAADKAAEEAAQRLTEIAMGVISFALIVLAVALAVAILKAIIRFARKKSVVLGFTDRLLGFVLGAVRGLLLAWIAVALLIPVTAIVSPENVAPVMNALKETEIARVMYDVNPLLYVVKLLMK